MRRTCTSGMRVSDSGGGGSAVEREKSRPGTIRMSAASRTGATPGANRSLFQVHRVFLQVLRNLREWRELLRGPFEQIYSYLCAGRAIMDGNLMRVTLRVSLPQ